MLPRVVYSMLLACAFGACSEDEPKCVCKPIMKMEVEQPTNQHLCNNETLEWLVDTLLSEISRLKDKEKEADEQVMTMRDKLLEYERQYQQAEKQRALEVVEVTNCRQTYDLLQEENMRLNAELRILQAENEKLRSTHKKVGVPSDCSYIQRRGSRYSGLYTIYPDGIPEGMEAFCDLDTNGGGWTVIQRRQDGTQRFDRSWDTYKKGFGQLAREFWLGNENIHYITQQQSYELRVDLIDFEGNHAYAYYDHFALEDESQYYTLRLGQYEGTAGDAMTHHKDHPFSTRDVDNDLSRSGHCSQLFGNGGWWFVRCYDSNLNGVYKEKDTNEERDGVIWFHLTHSHKSLLHVEMKIRPVGFSIHS